jgi:thiol-disulfide isomerase/thioredoxin
MQPPTPFVATLQSYNDYAGILATNFSIIANISERHAPERAALRQSGISNFPITFRIVSGLQAGRQREDIMENIFKNGRNIPPDYLDSLPKYISASRLERFRQQTETESSTLTQLLQTFSLNEKEKQELLNLYAGTEGKVVFHDFWFLNCAPCMAELPHYNQLIDAAGDSTQFIFLGTYMNRDNWQQTIQKYNLKGMHLLLSKNQLAFFERYFEVKGFPHHQLLNAKGEIINRHIPAATPDNHNWIVKILTEVRTDGH